MPSCTLSGQILKCTGTGTLNQQNSADFANAKKIIIEPGITVLSTYCFQNFQNIEEIDLGEVQRLDDDIITDSKIQSLFIPKTLVTMSPWVSFDQNEKLSTITVDEDNPKYCAIDNVIYSKDMKQIYFAAPNHNISIFTTPYSVTSFGRYTFSHNKFIKHIVFLPLCKFPSAISFPDPLETITILQYFYKPVNLSSISDTVNITYMTMRGPFTNCRKFNIHLSQCFIVIFLGL